MIAAVTLRQRARSPTPARQSFWEYTSAEYGPTPTAALHGIPSRGWSSVCVSKLGWVPKVQTDQLARIMVDADIEALQHEGRQWIDRPVLDDWPVVGSAR